MDLKFLIPSKMRRRLLAYFVEDPNAEVSIRELARELEEAPQLVYRELINLENWGMLFSRKRGNERAFYLNKKFPLYPTIVDLFSRFREEQERDYEIHQVLDWKKLQKKYAKIPIPEDMKKRLTLKRNRPRAYAEEIILKKKGML